MTGNDPSHSPRPSGDPSLWDRFKNARGSDRRSILSDLAERGDGSELVSLFRQVSNHNNRIYFPKDHGEILAEMIFKIGQCEQFKTAAHLADARRDFIALFNDMPEPRKDLCLKYHVLSE